MTSRFSHVVVKVLGAAAMLRIPKACSLKPGGFDPNKHHRKYGGARAKRPILFSDAMKRLLVLDGLSHMSGRSGLLAPREGLAEPIGKAKRQFGLAKGPRAL